MKNYLVAALSIAASATALPLAVTAHAQDLAAYDFQSPSGNIGCTITDFVNGTGAVSCTLHERTWATPSEVCPDTGLPQRASDLILNRGAAACMGITPSQIWLAQETGKLPTLEYGQSHTLGSITCASETSGVRCADAQSGHFFQVSRDSYQLG